MVSPINRPAAARCLSSLTTARKGPLSAKLMLRRGSPSVAHYGGNETPARAAWRRVMLRAAEPLLLESRGDRACSMLAKYASKA